MDNLRWIILLLTLNISTTISSSTITKKQTTINPPICYYRFENISNPGQDSIPGNKGLLINRNKSSIARAQTQQGNANSVGNFMVVGYGLETLQDGWPAIPTPWGASGCNFQNKHPKSLAQGITIEFLIHPTPQCFLRGGFASVISSTTGHLSFSITYSSLSFTAKAKGDVNETDGVLLVPLEGEGVLASDYLWSTTNVEGKWHHIALVRGEKDQSIWIDGEHQVDLMRKNSTLIGGLVEFGDIIMNEKSATNLCSGIDEVAIYDYALEGTAIYTHSQDALVKKMKYSMIDAGILPTPIAYPNKTNASYYDISEYTPGTILPSPGSSKPGGGGNNTQCVDCLTCLDQLQFAPDPKFNTTALEKWNTYYNFNWMDPWNYMPGFNAPYKYEFALQIIENLASRWHYGISLSTGARSKNLSISLANNHTEWPLHGIIPGEGGALHNNSLPDGCYMQNIKGQFITILGDIIPTGQPRTLRPMSTETAIAKGCPDSIFNLDNGVSVREKRFSPLKNELERPIDVLNCDGEVFIGLMSHRDPAAPAELYDYSKDPISLADYNASGAPNWLTFFSEWRLRLTQGWSSTIMKNSSSTGKVFNDAKFSMYQVQGTNPYFGNWTVTRNIGDKWLDHSPNAIDTYSFYSTVDIYLQHPNRWWVGAGPDHGIAWLENVRKSEIANGDLKYSPFVAAGWSGQAEKNLRPAQWLGLLKIMTAWGAEFFYTGFFSLRAPFQPPENWCWQAMMPSYAQALMTQYADFFYKGNLVKNTENTTFAMGGDDGTNGSPLLWAGAPNVLAIARELNGDYLLTVTIQRLSNANGNLASIGKLKKGRLCHVYIPGAGMVQALARPQGSVYICKKNNVGKFELTQVDAGHGAEHPLLWK